MLRTFLWFCSGITLGRDQGPSGMLEIEPRSTTCKARALSSSVTLPPRLACRRVNFTFRPLWDTSYSPVKLGIVKGFISTGRLQ